MAELQLPTLRVEIDANGKAAVQEIEKVGDAANSAGESAQRLAAGANQADESLNRVGDTAQRTGSRLEEIQKSAEKLGSSLTKYLTLPIVAAYTASVKGAADLVETVGKTEVVFGQFYDQIDKWSQNSIQTMGVARSTALDMASLYGDMATGMGFAQDAAADMAMQLSSLAADMASFKNISIETAQTALKSVFTGETESLKNLGVVMTQANLQAYALSQGIEKNIADMTQAEQVTLRYNYVMAQTVNAQGDFARTGDSLSNQSRKLVQTVKQLGETMGTLLIPKVTSVVNSLQNAAQWLAELDSGTQNTILTIGMAVAAVGPMLIAGTKLLKLITAIKAALVASTLGPITLAVMGAVAAAGLLAAAVNSSKKEIDETTESYKRMKKILEGGIESDAVEIKISANGEQALADAKAIIAKLKSDEYKGTLVIDGDTGEADQALDALESAVNAMLSGNGSLAELQAAVDRCKQLSISPEIDPQKQLELEQALTDLRGTLVKLGNIDINFNYKEEGDSGKFQTFIDEVNGLGWESKTFTATGEFTVSESTLDEIEEYSNALTAAASATGDYGTAIEALNRLLDQRLGDQMQEITDQADEAIREQARLYNNGIIDEATYNSNVQTILDGAQEAKEALEEEAKQAKELNEILNNGERGDDYGYVAQQYAELYKGEKISDEDWQGAVAHLKEAAEAGEDLTESQTEAAIALEGLKQRSVESYNEMIAAKEAYDQAMSGASDKDAQAEEADALAERADQLQDYLGELEIYRQHASSTEDAINQIATAFGGSEEEAAQLKETLTGLLSDEDGKLVGTKGLLAKITEAQDGLENEKNKATEKAETLRTEAETVRTEAAEAFSSSMEQIQDAVGLSTTGINELLGVITSAGVTVSSADAEMIAGISGLIDSAATTLEDGKPEVANGVSEMLGGIADKKSEAEGQGSEVGSAITSGITAGLDSGTNALYRKVRSIVNGAIKQAKKAAEINSPSRRMRDEVGKMFIRGFSEGMDEEMPDLLSGVTENMNRVISGAQAVVNRGAYTFPATESAKPSGIDYQRMGEVLSDAVQDTPVALVIKDKEIARTTSEATARQQAIRAQRINRGKGRW
jgi:hypothetical protein